MAARSPYDPNPIPHAGRAGRLGETEPDEPEERASSVQAPPEGEEETPLPSPAADAGDEGRAGADDAADRRRPPPTERRRG